jgi:peptidoglycan hydrolase-like protein with peptidoglycan-binding domain
VRRALATTIAAVVVLTLGAGCETDTPTAQGPTPTTSAPVSSPAPGPTVSAAPTTPATPAPLSPTPRRKLKSGAEGPDVLALQQRLTELGYWNGKADGKFGDTTRQAVYALQKAAGLGRDGSVGPKTFKALDRGVRPKARSTGGTLVEIDLKRQLLLLVTDGQVTQAFNTSTGSN